ncbi:putative alpha/beta hydrolase [Aspergillus steynii IBT 23096]|uniref:Putative alpha/beta hydrolase n=1 Tax=Aspergillus steynii IBT 23096 TaxID=1392250 RepID=A0A2I2GPQ1_9EURO|nr:putative alpha/beta hydrolase [Aspergillus steynii IBT 23096]PLB54855.1 putative alpha/beta hydrolase [Aspergillus steynii IBT 23096]
MSSLTVNISPETSIHARITRPITPSNKPLLVFLHYWGGSSSTWHKLTSPGSPTTLVTSYPTVALDLRGWGESTGPSDTHAAHYSISALASDVASVLQHIQSNSNTRDLLAHGFLLVGHSMGAKVSLATLSILPAQLLQQLRGLVLVAPAPPTSLELPSEMKDQQKVAYQNEKSIRWTVENVLANAHKLSEQDMDLIIRVSLSGNQLAKEAWPAYGMQEDITENAKRALGLVSYDGFRVRVLVGELDIVEPKERVEDEVVRFFQEIGVGVSLRTVEGVGHLIPLEDPEVVQNEIAHF